MSWRRGEGVSCSQDCGRITAVLNQARSILFSHHGTGKRPDWHNLPWERPGNGRRDISRCCFPPTHMSLPRVVPRAARSPSLLAAGRSDQARRLLYHDDRTISQRSTWCFALFFSKAATPLSLCLEHGLSLPRRSSGRIRAFWSLFNTSSHLSFLDRLCHHASVW